MSRLADDCMERVLRGERLYIHCWGGHGRTGTLVATMLGRLYNLPYTTAIRYCQAFHDSRMYPQGVRSPQTPVQRAQVCCPPARCDTAALRAKAEPAIPLLYVQFPTPPFPSPNTGAPPARRPISRDFVAAHRRSGSGVLNTAAADVGGDRLRCTCEVLVIVRRRRRRQCEERRIRLYPCATDKAEQRGLIRQGFRSGVGITYAWEVRRGTKSPSFPELTFSACNCVRVLTSQSGVLPCLFPPLRPGVSITPNRYGPPSRSIGESPMRGSSGDVRSSYGALLRQQQGASSVGSLPQSSSSSSIDRLSAGFSKLQGPGGGGATAGALSKGGASGGPYSLSAQR